MNMLIATVGLPRSGKSTWAIGYSKRYGIPIVNPDSIRLSLHGQMFEPKAEPIVWAISKIMVRSLFGAGHNFVILDATNTTKARRDEWREPETWDIQFRFFDTPADVCIERADLVLTPVIKRMNEKFDLLQDDEIAFTE